MIFQPHIFTFFFLFGLFSLSLHATTNEVIRGHASEIPISSSYRKALIDAGILMDAIADQEDDFWILSQKNLIRWSVDEGSFRFLNLDNPSQKSYPRAMTEVGGNQLLIGADTWFAIFNGENLDITWFKFPWTPKNENQRLLSLLNTENNHAYLVHEHGILKYNQDGKFESTNFPSLDLSRSSYACIDTAGKFVYKVENKKLYFFDLLNRKQDMLEDDTYLGVSCHNNGLIFARSEKFYSVWQSGIKKQQIQFSAERKILAKDIQNQYHSFLFNDGLLDIYDLKNKKHLQFQVPKPTGKVQKLLTIPKRILIVEDKTLKAYQLSWLDR